MAATATYTILIEHGAHNLSAFIPDLPGCVATGRTEEEVVRNLREAATDHLALMIEDGDSIPEPTVTPSTITIPVAVRA